MRACLPLTAVALALATGACTSEPRGKDHFERHPDELAAVLKACADGTHNVPQECANAVDVDILRKARGSLGQ
ncbi:EexN family lipoprotein [Sphingobium scionense]